MSRPEPMTVDGADQLQTELDHLRKVERPRITKAIAEARGAGRKASRHAPFDEQAGPGALRSG